MDVVDKDKLDTEKRNEDCNTTSLPSEWRSGGANFANSSMGMVLPEPMVDSYGGVVWEHPVNSQPLGFNGINGHSSVNVNPSHTIGLARWQEPNSVLKGSLLLPMPSISGNFEHLPQIPADAAFIERAARFSCFNSENAADFTNSFAMNQPVNPPSTSKNVPLKNARCVDEAKQTESDEAESGGVGGQEEPSLMDTGSEPSLSKGSAPKKRKRGGQDTEPEQCEDANKIGKQSSQASDPTKEEYIHVRARRGQATNSHSLAERVRREKISERMKLLQDLVPGCSKVTGKAVMLDEIINYVQSLQRQVEFLSMKLASVDPRLDFNIDSLFAKDQLFAARAGPSSTLGFSPDVPMAYPPMHPPQSTVIQPSLPVIGNSNQQMTNVWDDELHNVVNMGFNPNAPLDNQETNSSLQPAHMKVEF